MREHGSIIIEGGIFVSHGIWLFRTRKLRKAAKLAGKTFDDLPESDEFHVEVARKGSIAASRDLEKNLVERRGSVALARELDKGEEMISGGINIERSGSAVKALDTVSEVSSIQTVDVGTKQQETRDEGVNAVDYGTLPRGDASTSRTRPGYARQDSNVSSMTVFRDPKW